MKKKELYGWLLNTMISAGWENISSRPSVDNDILYSKGESGEEDLYIRLKEYYSTSTTSTLSTTTDIYLSSYPLRSYKPGGVGVSGIADPPLATGRFQWGRIARAATHLETPLTVYYHCNKDRIVFIVEWTGYTEFDSNFFLFGKPSNLIVKKSDTSVSVTVSGYGYTSSSVYISDVADDDSDNSAYVASLTQLDIPRSINSSNRISMSEVGITQTFDGFHSIVDGIYGINKDSRMENTRVLNGDELLDDKGNVYRMTSVVPYQNSNYFNTPFPLIAFRIQ